MERGCFSSELEARYSLGHKLLVWECKFARSILDGPVNVDISDHLTAILESFFEKLLVS